MKCNLNKCTRAPARTYIFRDLLTLLGKKKSIRFFASLKILKVSHSGTQSNNRRQEEEESAAGGHGHKLKAATGIPPSV